MTSQVKVFTPKLPQDDGRAVDAIIRTNNLSKRFGDEVAVQNVTFYVPRGKIFGFIGPSGSGKTTTIRMLTGFYEPSEGEVFVLDTRPVDFTTSLREQIGYMPQLFVLYPNLSVWENMNFVASIYGMGFRRSRRLNELLDFVELTDHKWKLARDISGGMQRRLALAATLVHEPELIFLDEPTAGVDPVLRSKFWDHFRSLRKENRTLFITTQYISEAAYCDLVGVMGRGRLLMVDTPQGLRYRAYGGDMVDMQLEERATFELAQELRDLDFVVGDVIRRGEHSLRLVVDEASTAVPELLEWCRVRQVGVESVEEYLPPFEEVFVKLVEDKEEVQRV